MSAWTFVGSGLGSHIAAIDFLAVGAVSVEEQTDDGFSLAPSGYSNATEFVCPTLTSGLLCFTFVGSTGVDIVPGNFVVTYGGLPAVVVGAEVSETEIDVVHVVGYVFIGESADLADNDFVMTVTGIGSPNVLDGALRLLFVEGIDQLTAGVFYSAGTVDSFVSPLSVTIAGGTGFVFTAAASGDLGAPPVLTNTTEDYIQGAAQNGSSASTQAIAWKLCETSYDCECDIDPDARTLLDMRIDTLSVSGYAANATNPGPGINRMYNNFIKLAQEYVYSKVRAMETSRFFTWALSPGVRYYGLLDNSNCCTVKLNRYKIEGAWIQDLNNTWWPLVYGIDPTSYTLDNNFGWPTHFEVRQCIELFPAPEEAYRLRIKGHYQLLPLVDDTDTTTIPSTPVLNYAIFLAKSHKGMTDANVYSAMADAQIAAMVAGRHVTRRYVPGAAEFQIATPPRMTTFDS